jgi:hypothetical protein
MAISVKANAAAGRVTPELKQITDEGAARMNLTCLLRRRLAPEQKQTDQAELTSVNHELSKIKSRSSRDSQGSFIINFDKTACRRKPS